MVIPSNHVRLSNNIISSYLEGGLPQTALGQSQAEAYLLDIPNGGTATIKDNVFAKNASGYNSNGISFTYALEGIPDSRKLAINVENNTFVTFTKVFDDQGHVVHPIQFAYPGEVPNDTAGVTVFNSNGTPIQIPVSNVKVQKNLFVGYCPAGDAVSDYRGDLSVTAAFSELNQSFTLTNKYYTVDDPSQNPMNTTTIVGTLEYVHVTQPGTKRVNTTVGARN